MHCDLQSWQSCLGKQTISSTATAVTSARRNGYARSIKKERNRKQYGSQFPYRCIYSELAKQCTSLVRSTFAPDSLFLIFSLLLELLHDHRSCWTYICEYSALHFSDTQQQLDSLQYTMVCTCSWWERLSCPAILPDRYRRQWKWIVTVSLAVVYFVSWGNIHSYPLLFGPLQEEFKTSAIETGKLICLKSWKWQRL